MLTLLTQDPFLNKWGCTEQVPSEIPNLWWPPDQGPTAIVILIQCSTFFTNDIRCESPTAVLHVEGTQDPLLNKWGCTEQVPSEIPNLWWPPDQGPTALI
jgi:hypothetical protein